jgi:hypothetical protein
MPMYIFENPETQETIEVFFHMNDDKKYFDDDGLEWKRVFITSELNTEGSIDPWDNASFVNSTANRKGTVGDLLDKSAELSHKRAESNGGVDPVKQKYYKKYSEDRGGVKHPSEMKKTFEDKNIRVDL